MATFLETLESIDDTDGVFNSHFEAVMGRGFVCIHVRDDVVFAMSTKFGLTAVENTTIGHISEVEEPPLRVSNVKHKTRKDLWEGGMKAESKGLVDLNAFEFVDVEHDDVNGVRDRLILPGRWTR